MQKQFEVEKVKSPEQKKSLVTSMVASFENAGRIALPSSPEDEGSRMKTRTPSPVVSSSGKILLDFSHDSSGRMITPPVILESDGRFTSKTPPIISISPSLDEGLHEKKSKYPAPPPPKIQVLTEDEVSFLQMISQ